MFLPALNPADAALLTRYLHAHEDLHALLAQPEPPALLPLLEFLARPDITPWLDHYRTIMAHAHRHAALNALSEVLRETTDPTQRRLAATALLNNRTPRPPHAPRESRSEAHGSNPWAPRAPRTSARPSSTPSPLDASMPDATPPCGLYAFPPLTHPASPTTADRAVDVPHRIDATPSAPLDPDNHLDLGLDQLIVDEIDGQDDDEDDNLDNDHDDTLSDDPLITAALTGDPAAIHRLYLERTGHPPDPILAATLSRALQPVSIPTD